MKKILSLFIISIVVLICLISYQVAVAADSTGSDSSTGAAGCNINQQITGGKSGTQLGREDAKNAVTLVANILAGASGTVALVFIIIGGIQLITSGGNQEQASKGKSTLTWAVIGFILIIASYGIISFFIGLIKGGA